MVLFIVQSNLYVWHDVNKEGEERYHELAGWLMKVRRRANFRLQKPDRRPYRPTQDKHSDTDKQISLRKIELPPNSPSHKEVSAIRIMCPQSDYWKTDQIPSIQNIKTATAYDITWPPLTKWKLRSQFLARRMKSLSHLSVIANLLNHSIL